MADHAMTGFTVDRQCPILLVTDDRVLELLVLLEAHELALPMVVVPELTDRPLEGQVLIADLNCRGGMQAVLSAEARAYIGICTATAEVPGMLRAGVLYLLEQPFATAELRALLCQLRSGVVSVQLPTFHEDRHERKDMVLSMETGTVSVRGVSIALTPKEVSLLQCLMERRGEAVPREVLSDRLATAGKESDSNKTEVYLCYLRRKLEKPTGRRWITTVRGVGYRLEWE